MIFELLIACRIAADDDDLRQAIVEQLAKALEDNLSEFDGDAVERMVRVRIRRDGAEAVEENGKRLRHALAGVTIDLPDEAASVETVIDEFVAALRDTPPMFHVLKFEDPLLRDQLSKRAAEIFSLEMKLRRVLSLIYLHAYQEGDPFDLLVDERTQPASKSPPTRDHACARLA